MLPSFARIAVGALAAGAIGVGAAAAQDSIRIGYAISLTGPNVGGASITTLPNYQLWVHEVNEAGGIEVGDRRLPIEVIEYDDRSNSEEAVRAIERLITQDEVDFVLSPWGTGLNLAVGPTFNRYGYPHLAATAATDRAYELGERWPNSFWMLGTSTHGAEALVEVLTEARESGQIGNRIAMASVADAFGIELSTAARPALEAAGFELVYDVSYPVGTSDLQPVLTEAMRAEPDAFVAFSYPPDTLGITDAARVLDFNPPVFYTAVGTAFPLFKQRFGEDVEGVFGIGGVNPDAPEYRAYFERHLEVTGQEPDRWASAYTYASLEMLQQAIERVGSLDREAIIEELRTGSFETVAGTIQLDRNVNPDVWWVGQWQDGEFYGLGPTRLPGAHEPRLPKPTWKGDQ